MERKRGHEMQKLSKIFLIREAYISFKQLSEEEYLILLREAKSEREKRFYVELHNKMLSSRQQKIISENEFVL